MGRSDKMYSKESDDEVSIEDENDDPDEFEDHENSQNQKSNLFVLETKDDDTLQDIYIRERMPRISEILTSGDAQKINTLIEETKRDPFAILPQTLKYHQLLGSDLFLTFMTRLMIYFIIVSLSLPIAIPI